MAMTEKRKTKSNQLADIMRMQIVSGQILPGSQLESIAKLAKRHETTIATVSKAMDMLERNGLIKRYAGKGVFAAQSYPCRVAVVFDISDEQPDYVLSPIFCKFARRRFQAEGWSYQEFFNVSDAESAAGFIHKASENAFDLILVCSRYIASKASAIFKNSQALIIGLYDYVGVENSMTYNVRQFVSSAVKLLNHHNVSDIMLLCNNRTETWRKIKNRPVAGYQEGLQSISRLYDPVNVQKQELSCMGGFQGANELFKRRKGSLMGIISVDSLMTLGIFQALIYNKLRIPEDVIVVSHANPECQITAPCLPVIYYVTPIEQQIEEIISMMRKYQKTGLRNFGDREIELVKHSEALEKCLFMAS
jgi:DNA-binding GntR family transcriptional regulator